MWFFDSNFFLRNFGLTIFVFQNSQKNKTNTFLKFKCNHTTLVWTCHRWHNHYATMINLLHLGLKRASCHALCFLAANCYAWKCKKKKPFGILLVKNLKNFVKFLYIKKLEKKEKPWNQELIKLYTSLCLRVKESLCRQWHC